MSPIGLRAFGGNFYHAMKNAVLLSFLLGLAWLSSCKKSGPEDALTLQHQSAHYNYYYAAHDELILDTEWMEQHYTWVTTTLAVNPTQKLDYYKYLNREHLSAWTGQNTNGFAEIGTWKFHSIWHPENHENVHSIVINTIGHPPALFNEGIAVALAPQPIYGKGVFNEAITWNGQSVDVIARNLRDNNQLPALSTLLESTAFFNHDTNKTYPVAGSFIKYLLANYPLTHLKTFFAQITFQSGSNQLNTQFLDAYGASLESVWDLWEESL